MPVASIASIAVIQLVYDFVLVQEKKRQRIGRRLEVRVELPLVRLGLTSRYSVLNPPIEYLCDALIPERGTLYGSNLDYNFVMFQTLAGVFPSLAVLYLIAR
jgi:hypothetical protein